MNFSTVSDWQDVAIIDVFQGEGDFCGQNESLGEFFLTNLTEAPAGKTKIIITFDINESDMLTVSAKEVGGFAFAEKQITVARNRFKVPKVEIKEEKLSRGPVRYVNFREHGIQMDFSRTARDYNSIQDFHNISRGA